MAHALDTCPDSPKNVFEVLEKFGATTLQPDTVVICNARGVTSPSENWVTVLLKKQRGVPNSHCKRGILPTPSCFTPPKVNTVPPPTPTPIVVVSDTSNAGGDMRTTSGTTLEPTALHANSSQARKSQVPPVVSKPKANLPINDENMDIFLNLEGDDDPQHSSESLKKRHLRRVKNSSPLTPISDNVTGSFFGLPSQVWLVFWYSSDSVYFHRHHLGDLFVVSVV